MIKALKKITLCREGLLFSSSFAFAEKSNVAFHKAVLASNIISMIRKSPLNNYRSPSFPSLKGSILQYIAKYEQDNTESEESEKNLILQAAKEVRNCFDEGVHVPLYMCDQTRFSEKEQTYMKIKDKNGQIEILNVNQKKKENQQEIDEEWLGKISFRKLSFVPTYVITGQIFRKIFNEGKYNLLTGQYGAGKTYSFILYTLLSEMIFRYRHEHCSQNLNQKLPEEIDFEIPKAIYLSMNLNENLRTQDYLKEKISQIFQFQCYELSDLWQKFDIFNLPKQLLKNYEKKGIDQLINLNDQINEVASAKRQVRVYFKLVQQLKNKRKELQNSGKTQDIKELNAQYDQVLDSYQQTKIKKKQAYRYLNLMIQACNRKNFSRILYLSSVDIQQDLLDSMNLMGYSKQQSITSKMERLQYPLTLSGNVAIADACELIALNLKQHWERLSIQKKQFLQQDELKAKLRDIEETLSEAMREKNYVFILPFACKKYFAELKDQNQGFESFKNRSGEQLKQKLHGLISSLQQKSIVMIGKKFTNFLTKDYLDKKKNQLKSILAFRLWAKAETILKKIMEESNVEDQQVDIDKFDRIQRLGEEFTFDLSPFQKLFENTDREKLFSQMLFIKKSGRSQFKIAMNPEVIIRCLNANKNRIYQMVSSSTEPIFQKINENRSALGFILEKTIIDLLGRGKTKFSYKFLVNQKPMYFKYSQINGPPSCFVSIPKSNSMSHKNKSFNFLLSFKIHVQTLAKYHQQRLNEWNILLPISRPPKVNDSKDETKYQQDLTSFLPAIINEGKVTERMDKTSKLIDFALCKYSQFYAQSNILSIHLFDVTAQQRPLQKFERFLVQFLNLKDRSQLSLQIHQKQVQLQVVYNVITTETFNHDYQAYFKGRMSSLQQSKKEGKLEQKNEKLLQALHSLTFKNDKESCIVNGINEKYCLKGIRIISIAQNNLKFENVGNEYDNLIFEKVGKELQR